MYIEYRYSQLKNCYSTYPDKNMKFKPDATVIQLIRIWIPVSVDHAKCILVS